MTIRESVTLWKLHRDGKTVSAEMCHVEGFGLELRYIRNGQPFAWLRFRDGSDLLKEAHVQRSGLEEQGWNVEFSLG
jgi:hypothetical protein